MVSVAFNFNAPAIQREMDAIGRQVLPRALAQQLDDTAFAVGGKVVDEIRRSVDRPRPFTVRPMKVTRAKWRDGDRMFASVDMLPAQADYLYFPITGQARHPGDPGTGRNDIMVFSSKPTAFGGAFNKASAKRLNKKAADEKGRRPALRAMRAAFRGPGPMPEQIKWKNVSRNAPGSFYGIVNGTHGLWQRPERYTSNQRFGLIGAARNRPGHISTGGSRLQLLLAYKPTVDTPVTIQYDTAVQSGYAQAMTEANFVRVLQAKKTWFINRL